MGCGAEPHQGWRASHPPSRPKLNPRRPHTSPGRGTGAAAPVKGAALRPPEPTQTERRRRRSMRLWRVLRRKAARECTTVLDRADVKQGPPQLIMRAVRRCGRFRGAELRDRGRVLPILIRFRRFLCPTWIIQC